jgi:hypothetical protein
MGGDVVFRAAERYMDLSGTRNERSSFGRNLVRLLYLDETGTSARASFLSVAGVIVHGDYEWPEVDRQIEALIEKYIRAPDRLGFVFHATDIFHGSAYFDRRKPEWATMDQRWPILLDLATIIDDLSLPIVAGMYRKAKFGLGLLAPQDQKHGPKARLIHNVAAIDCLIAADRWLERFAPTELATVVHEDGTPAKPLIKLSVQVLRSTERMSAEGLDESVRKEFNLPLRRIIDTVHFAEKAGARPLQLADLCAFMLGRAMQERSVPSGVFEIIWKHLRWLLPQDQVSKMGAILQPISE